MTKITDKLAETMEDIIEEYDKGMKKLETVKKARTDKLNEVILDRALTNLNLWVPVANVPGTNAFAKIEEGVHYTLATWTILGECAEVVVTLDGGNHSIELKLDLQTEVGHEKLVKKVIAFFGDKLTK